MSLKLSKDQLTFCTGLCQERVFLSKDEARAMHTIDPLALCDTCTSRPLCEEAQISPSSDSCHLIRRAETGI